MVFPHPVVMRVAISIQPLEFTVIFVKHDSTKIDLFVSRRKMAYPTIGESVLLSTGFQWIVIDEDPLVVAFASGGGGRDTSKKKTLFH